MNTKLLLLKNLFFLVFFFFFVIQLVCNKITCILLNFDNNFNIVKKIKINFYKILIIYLTYYYCCFSSINIFCFFHKISSSLKLNNHLNFFSLGFIFSCSFPLFCIRVKSKSLNLDNISILKFLQLIGNSYRN